LQQATHTQRSIDFAEIAVKILPHDGFDELGVCWYA
jgi:hypothetical protein